MGKFIMFGKATRTRWLFPINSVQHSPLPPACSSDCQVLVCEDESWGRRREEGTTASVVSTQIPTRPVGWRLVPFGSTLVYFRTRLLFYTSASPATEPFFLSHLHHASS